MLDSGAGKQSFQAKLYLLTFSRDSLHCFTHQAFGTKKLTTQRVRWLAILEDIYREKEIGRGGGACLVVMSSQVLAKPDPTFPPAFLSDCLSKGRKGEGLQQIIHQRHYPFRTGGQIRPWGTSYLSLQ